MLLSQGFSAELTGAAGQEILLSGGFPAKLTGAAGQRLGRQQVGCHLTPFAAHCVFRKTLALRETSHSLELNSGHFQPLPCRRKKQLSTTHLTKLTDVAELM
jgi:hypothetical protein